MDDRKRLLLGYEVDIWVHPEFKPFDKQKKEEYKFKSAEELLEWLDGSLQSVHFDENLSIYGVVEMPTGLHCNIHTFEREELVVVVGHELPPRSAHDRWDYLFDAITKLITAYDNKVCKDHLEFMGFNKGNKEPVEEKPAEEEQTMEETHMPLLSIIKQNHKILTQISDNGMAELRAIENISRDCYESINTGGDEETLEFIKKRIKDGHLSVLEHLNLTVRFTTDRGIANELVRHRLASFTQESTRYCDYSKRGLSVVAPVDFMGDPLSPVDLAIWQDSMTNAATNYKLLVDRGVPIQLARDVLPTCTATKITVTANYREWRHILSLRTAPNAHPKMRALMIPLLEELKQRLPVIFDDINYKK